MKSYQFFLFFSVFLTIYTWGNIHVFLRGWRALPDVALVRIIYSILFVIAALSFILGEIFEKNGIFENIKFFILAGSTWLAFLFYTLLLLLFIDLIRLLNFFFNFLPSKEILDANNIPLKIMAGVVFTVIIILISGIITASNPAVRHVSIKIDRPAGIEKSIKIAVASDVHLGRIVGRKKLTHLVNTINSVRPDIVLFPGDFFDETLGPVVKDNMGGLVESIRAKYGVYAVTGNHEFIGGVDAAVGFMNKHKIRVLRDEAVEINGSVILAGREDKFISRFTGIKRKSVDEILRGKNPALPVVIMDHQPSSIDESAANNIDLHLSGHTHNGQLWPVNFITDAIFKVSCGYKKIDNTNVYVSKGYGTWGPPVRTTGRPEIVVIDLQLK